MTFKFSARNHNHIQFLFSFTFPVADLVEPSRIVTVDTDDEATMQQIFTFPEAQMGNLAGGFKTDARGFGIREGPDEFKDAKGPIHRQVALGCPSIVRVSFAVPKSAIVKDYDYKFFNDSKSQDPDLVRLASDLTTKVFQSPEPILSITAYIGCPANKYVAEDWGTLAGFIASDHPFPRTYISHSSSGVSGLTYDNVDISNMAYMYPRLQVNRFINSDHRTVALIAGSAEEVAYQNHLGAEAYRTSFPALYLPDSQSLWRPNPDHDLRTYGVVGDNSPRQLFVLLDLGKNPELLPDIGESVFVYPQVAVRGRAIPKDMVKNIATLLPPGNEETDRARLGRIAKWIREAGATAADCARPDGRTSFQGIRLPLPMGISSRLALLYVDVPLCSIWPPGLKQPPALANIQYVTKMPSLRHFIKEAMRNNPTTPTKVFWKGRDVTARSECDAISRLCNSDDLPDHTATFWQWTATMQEFPGPWLNLLKRFPGLIALRDRASIPSDWKSILADMEFTKAGHVFINGPPGSGKTTLSMEIMAAAVQMPAQDGWITEEAEVNRLSTKYGQHVPTFNNTIEAASTAGCPHAVTATEEQPARAVWIAPSNELCRDAFQQAKKRIPELIIRLYPFHVEAANMMATIATPPKPVVVTDRASRTEVALTQHIMQWRVDRYESMSPSADDHSLSQISKRLAPNLPGHENFIKDLQEWEAQPELFGKERVEELQKQGREIMEQVAATAAVMVATPVTFAQLASRINIQAQLVIVDEAARMSESQALIPLAFLKQASCIFVGDPRQFGPTSLLADARGFHNVFSLQRRVSLLHRACATENADGALVYFYSCHGNIAEWAQDYVYKTSGSIIHEANALTDMMKTFLNRLVTPPGFKRKYPIYTNCAWLSIETMFEDTVGTSFVNHDQARFVVQLAKQLFVEGPVADVSDFLARGLQPDTAMGTVMIVCGYAQQKAVYQGLIAAIPASQIPPGRLTVRTIDDSQGHEASVVIVDLVRTESCGFLNDTTRLVVATTRAQVGLIIVGNENIVPRKGPLQSLYRWYEWMDAVFWFGREYRLDLWCRRCEVFGHMENHCVTVIKCSTCGADHLGSACKEGEARLAPMILHGSLVEDNVDRRIQNILNVAKNRKRV
ncbi:hypothetical protein CDD80_3938 [Ophiocordyceps camponoti-rufipedis]|uniref:DNA2/NAM7 helicase-like C-terminal domain-containing protein n=1 Tax=Ophiocordyceps camponoti-rufipedis TaxID=2004952 RepID=A0A2C5YWW0_9HYPO|nr:hypothetical protein CDD80_3938 [Ophiocordyceps camponoti-rufipedis]